MIWYLVSVNFLSFLLYGIDKIKAIKNKYRISEKSLLIMSFFGGGIGSLLGMKVFRHKTKKISFWIVNILLTIIWIIFLFFSLSF